MNSARAKPSRIGKKAHDFSRSPTCTRPERPILGIDPKRIVILILTGRPACYRSHNQQIPTILSLEVVDTAVGWAVQPGY
jgi:hypothetical protein